MYKRKKETKPVPCTQRTPPFPDETSSLVLKMGSTLIWSKAASLYYTSVFLTLCDVKMNKHGSSSAPCGLPSTQQHKQTNLALKQQVVDNKAYCFQAKSASWLFKHLSSFFGCYCIVTGLAQRFTAAEVLPDGWTSPTAYLQTLLKDKKIAGSTEIWTNKTLQHLCC